MSTSEQFKQSLAEAARPESMKDLIEGSAKELEKALPAHMNAERIMRIALTCIRLNPELSKCTPQSFMGALFTAAQIGIEPVAGRAYLLPFNNNRKKPDGTWHTVKECQFVLGYRGLIDLFYRHEKTIDLNWGIVREKDFFEYQLGTNAFLTHKPAKSDRGSIVGYWAAANLVNGGRPFHYMTAEECIEHGKKHSKTYNKKKGEWFESSPWVTETEAMCLKTVLTQGAKLWPISIELQRAIGADETSRDFRRGIDNVLDIPDQTNWDDVADKVEHQTQELQKEGDGGQI